MRAAVQFMPVVEALHSDSRVAQVSIFGSPGFKGNGKVFALLVKGKLVAKLPKERVAALVAAGRGKYCDPPATAG